MVAGSQMVMMVMMTVTQLVSKNGVKDTAFLSLLGTHFSPASGSDHPATQQTVRGMRSGEDSGHTLGAAT